MSRSSPEASPAPESDRAPLTLEAAGITLVGVIVGAALTVAFGLDSVLWVRVTAGLGTALALGLLVRVGATRLSSRVRANAEFP